MANKSDYAALVQERRRQLERDKGARERLQTQLRDTDATIETLTREVGTLELVQQLALQLEKDWRAAYEQHVADTCSEGVSLVFGEPLAVRVQGGIKAGASAVRFTLDNGEGETDIIDAEGRSLTEVVTFLLRAITIFEARPALEHFVTLDEAFGGVSDENVPALAVLLRKLVDESDLQLLFVTHNRNFADMADRVYEVSRKDGVGRVKLLRAKADSHLYEEES